MPRVSEFYGIVIAMFYNDHEPPHFHAIYGEFQAIVGIDPVAVMRGELPSRASNLVREWATQHRDELFANWERAREHAALQRIAPLE